jgi:hypothetical protein
MHRDAFLFALIPRFSGFQGFYDCGQFLRRTAIKQERPSRTFRKALVMIIPLNLPIHSFTLFMPDDVIRCLLLLRKP